MKYLLFVLLITINYCLKAQSHKNPYAVLPDTSETVTFKNPVIPGFYSDPSVCRVGEDYYLVTSTFEYYPGVPVFHSRDLVNWKQIGHCIHRPDQITEKLNIFAATIRHHNGVFYMITTNVTKSGNFYVTATNPAGPWSDPIWIDVPGIDPDLFFDDDGKAYVISSPFILYEINIKTGELITEGRKIYHGAGGRYAEGPHIYKKDGFYYLMAAEGGTEEAHHETIARSNSIWGPYIENPANPILAHANAAGQKSQIQGVGHADIVQAHDESWWIMFHGYRKIIGYPVHHILGRETCLAPVSWPKNAWPVVNGNGVATVNMTYPTLPLMPFTEESARDEFESGGLGLVWNTIQPPKKDDNFYEFKKGKLHIKGKKQQVGAYDVPAFIGRRLQHHEFEAITQMEFNPKNENEEAGLALVNNGKDFDLLVKSNKDRRTISAKLQFGTVVYESEVFELKPGPVNLKIACRDGKFVFSFSQNNDFIEIESIDARYLSTETVGWFTGVYVGMYATGNGKPNKAKATYEYFEYKEK